MKCWICGIEPELVGVTRLEDAQPRFVPGPWPSHAADHDHAVRPPTPGELAQAGDAAISRIRAIAAE